MNIRYIDPFSQGWDRMTKALFKPFDIGKWFAVGFTAFLAGLTDFNNGGGGGGNNSKSDVDFEEIANFPYFVWQWLMDNPGWLTLIIIGAAVILGLIFLFTWLSSRGKFMFLDNVVHDRKLVKKPWNDFRELGNSLFWWRIVFNLIVLAVFLYYFWYSFTSLYNEYIEYGMFESMISSIIGIGLFGLLLFMITAYISVFLSDFVVPLMYKYNLKTLEAWNRFLGLFQKYVLYFILYGLFKFFAYILFIILIILAGIFTCCIGFLFLVIPYIGSVVTLPVSYAFRAFSVEFLEQFGEEFKFFPDSPQVSQDGLSETQS